MSKKPRFLIAVILTLALCFSLAPMSAVANPTDAVETDTAAITKLLKVPVGTDYPAMEFEFSVTPVNYNNASPASAAGVPTIGPITIDFDGTAETADSANPTGNIDSYWLESDDLFTGVSFPQAGIYEYTIKETGSDYVIAPGDTHEALELSQAEYTMYVYVKDKDEHGDPCTPYIFAVGVVMTKDDDGDPVINGPKLDPTPGGDGGTTLDYSQLIFTNKYVKTNGSGDPDDPDPTDPGDSTLIISKEVDGEFGSYTQYFEFELKLDVPTLISDFVLAFYPAYVVDSNGIVADISGNADASLIDTDANGDDFIKFAPGAVTEFKLMHDQRLVFINTPVGTEYTVTETAETGYETTITVTYDGGTPVDLALDVMVANNFVGEGFNAAEYLNDYADNTPAGLNIGNWSFIVLILVGAAGIIAFFVMKGRRKEQYSEV